MASVVSYIGGGDGSKCGYCNSASGSRTLGIWLYSLTCQDYQDLLDRGFRRSGEYLYHMDMKTTCCPPYTIKCDAVNFKISRSQKKVLKTMTNFLTVRSTQTVSMGEASNHADASAGAAGDADDRKSKAVTVCAATSTQAVKSRPYRSGKGADPNRQPCRKAKEVRKERKLLKAAQDQLKSSSVSGPPADAASQSASATSTAGRKCSDAKSIEEFAVEVLPGQEPVHRLTTALIPAEPKHYRFLETKAESLELYRKYQMAVHGDPRSKVTEKQWNSFLCRSPLELELACDDDPGDGDEASKGSSVRYGSFHRHYYLDGKLVAVGVMDILPHSLSSVYAYYDPDLPELSLGTYTALREIMFTRELQQLLPELKWYYMGFYIHDCPKMRYKGNFTPSLLLCPERLTWQPIEECTPKLDVSKYARLDPAGSDVPETEKPVRLEDLQMIPILLDNGHFQAYREYVVMNGDHNRRTAERYAALVGEDLARRMLLVFQ